ncbi:MAG: saccharopine dehydrogenase NADP-binding domain-containing protein [Acidobacteriia bacterium]|nr:saccharopine dehydrogenase NADP-binding domain-containing protein [Terriglobia bacterium]
MKILVLGAGMMGTAAAWDLARSQGVERVGIADADGAVLARAVKRIGKSKVRTHRLDITHWPKVTALMHRYDAAIGAVSYHHNFQLAQCAIEAGCHFCDLGGNDRIVAKEFSLHASAQKKGVRIVPDCGLAPGMVSIVVAEGLRHFTRVDYIQIRVGGLPLHPKPPLNYQLVFSVGGLINEYVEEARVLENGKITLVEPMTGLETLVFPPPFGNLEAFYTSGGASTLPLTLKGRVRELNYKTIRYPGHCEKFKTLIDLGLTSSNSIRIEERTIAPRQILERLLVRRLPAGEPDCVLIRVTLRGTPIRLTAPRGGRKARVTRSGGPLHEISYQLIDYYDPKTKLTAMMRTTAFPVSIVAQMLCRGDVNNGRYGVLRQENSLPPAVFLNELKARGICFERHAK